MLQKLLSFKATEGVGFKVLRELQDPLEAIRGCYGDTMVSCPQVEKGVLIELGMGTESCYLLLWSLGAS